MERNIKFRGRDASGQYIYGSLVKFKMTNPLGNMFEDTYIVSGMPNYENFGETVTVRLTRVAPSSVEQFTGLFDKNGLEIYENDLLCGVDGNGHICLPRFFVKHDNFSPRFILKDLDTKGEYQIDANYVRHLVVVQ